MFVLSHKPSSLTCERTIMFACCYHAESVCAGLEEAVQTMKLHEVAEVVVQPQYGYGSEEHQTPETTIPANSTLFYTVELTDLGKVCACAIVVNHPAILFIYVYTAQGLVYCSPCCCQVSLLLTATTVYDTSCKCIGDFSALTAVVLEEGKRKERQSHWVALSRKACLPLSCILSTCNQSMFSYVMYPVCCSRRKGTKWTTLRSWMRLRRGRMPEMISSGRPSERLPLFSHYVLPHIYVPCITVDWNAVSMVPTRCCQCTQFAQLCFAPTAMKLSHCVCLQWLGAKSEGCLSAMTMQCLMVCVGQLQS